MNGKAAIQEATLILQAGGLVAFPTETVYGLGADASNADAIERLYKVKGRAPTHPVIVHFESAESAFSWASTIPESAKKLAGRYWPGPLTIILKRASHVGDYLTGGQDSVGLRVPSHPVANSLLRAFGNGVAAPSANRSGAISPTCAAHVRADLGADVDLVLEGGASEVGIESTILDLSRGMPVLLRPGHIGSAQLAAVLGEAVREPDREAPRFPGGQQRHYAPRTPARLVAAHELDAAIAELEARAAVLAFSRPDERVDYWLRMPRNAGDYARKLYAALRELDETGCQAILIEAPPDTGEWSAVRDRLRRATAG